MHVLRSVLKHPLSQVMVLKQRNTLNIIVGLEYKHQKSLFFITCNRPLKWRLPLKCGSVKTVFILKDKNKINK